MDWDFLGRVKTNSGLEIATDTVANVTNIYSLATKNSGLATKFGDQIFLWLRFKLKD